MCEGRESVNLVAAEDDDAGPARRRVDVGTEAPSERGVTAQASMMPRISSSLNRSWRTTRLVGKVPLRTWDV